MTRNIAMHNRRAEMSALRAMTKDFCHLKMFHTSRIDLTEREGSKPCNNQCLMTASHTVPVSNSVHHVFFYQHSCLEHGEYLLPARLHQSWRHFTGVLKLSISGTEEQMAIFM